MPVILQLSASASLGQFADLIWAGRANKTEDGTAYLPAAAFLNVCIQADNWNFLAIHEYLYLAIGDRS